MIAKIPLESQLFAPTGDTKMATSSGLSATLKLQLTKSYFYTRKHEQKLEQHQLHCREDKCLTSADNGDKPIKQHRSSPERRAPIGRQPTGHFNQLSCRDMRQRLMADSGGDFQANSMATSEANRSFEARESAIMSIPVPGRKRALMGGQMRQLIGQSGDSRRSSGENLSSSTTTTNSSGLQLSRDNGETLKLIPHLLYQDDGCQLIERSTTSGCSSSVQPTNAPPTQSQTFSGIISSNPELPPPLKTISTASSSDSSAAPSWHRLGPSLVEMDQEDEHYAEPHYKPHSSGRLDHPGAQVSSVAYGSSGHYNKPNQRNHRDRATSYSHQPLACRPAGLKPTIEEQLNRLLDLKAPKPPTRCRTCCVSSGTNDETDTRLQEATCDWRQQQQQHGDNRLNWRQHISNANYHSHQRQHRCTNVVDNDQQQFRPENLKQQLRPPTVVSASSSPYASSNNGLLMLIWASRQMRSPGRLEIEREARIWKWLKSVDETGYLATSAAQNTPDFKL